MDKYDSYGRNLTEQATRQNNIPWVKVVYVRGKMFIPQYIKVNIPTQSIVRFN